MKHGWRGLAVAASLLLGGGCASLPDAPEVIRLAADATRLGNDGDAGPHGVGCATVRRNTHLSDGATIHLCWPVDTEQTRVPGAFPAAIVIPGGLVSAERYAWLQTHLVSRGYVVALPEFPLDLALLDAEPAVAARALLGELAAAGDAALAGSVSLTNGVGILGHSLGGVVATQRWLDDADLGALVLLASFPADGDDVQARAGDPVLVLSGARDGASTPVEVSAGFERFGTPRWMGLVSGMNHYDWTDGVRDDERAGDQAATRPTTASRRDALRLLDAFLDAQLGGDPQGWARLDASVFPGVEIRR